LKIPGVAPVGYSIFQGIHPKPSEPTPKQNMFSAAKTDSEPKISFPSTNRTDKSTLQPTPIQNMFSAAETNIPFLNRNRTDKSTFNTPKTFVFLKPKKQS